MLHPIPAHQLAEFVSEVSSMTAAPCRRIVVHGLLGHHPEVLSKQLADIDSDIDLWAHDYFATCSSYTLTQNNLRFCGGPPVRSMSCSVCTHGHSREGHLAAIEQFLSLPRLTVVAPSAAAADVWRRAARRAGLTVPPVEVVPHGSVTTAGSIMPRPASELPCIAFAGYASVHKGWPMMEELHRWAMSRRDIRLVHLGERRQKLPGVEHIPVGTGTEQSMTEALINAKVDAVLVWPAWPETFSLVTYEAIAADCLVITHPRSGNVMPAAREYGRDLVFADEAALRRAGIDGSLGALIRNRRPENPRLGAFQWTGLTPSRMQAS
jgi:hypothetical protein